MTAVKVKYQRETGNRMIGCGLSLGRADRLGQPRLSEDAQPYPAAAGWPVVGAWLRRPFAEERTINFLNPHLNLITRTWLLMAETRDLKNHTPSQSSGLRFPLP
jgi:hypothetical protein